MNPLLHIPSPHQVRGRRLRPASVRRGRQAGRRAAPRVALLLLLLLLRRGEVLDGLLPPALKHGAALALQAHVPGALLLLGLGLANLAPLLDGVAHALLRPGARRVEPLRELRARQLQAVPVLRARLRGPAPEAAEDELRLAARVLAAPN